MSLPYLQIRKWLTSAQCWAYVLAFLTAPTIGFAWAHPSAWLSVNVILIAMVILCVYLGGRRPAIIAIVVTSTVLAVIDSNATESASAWWLNADRWLAFFVASSVIIVLLESLRVSNRRALDREQEVIAMLAAFPDGALVVDDYYNIRLINAAACQLNACDESSSIGRPFTSLFHIDNDKQQRIDVAMLSVLITNAPQSLLERYTLLRNDGKQIPVDLRVRRIHDNPSGESPETIMITVRDSTQQRRAENMLPGATNVFRVTAEGAVSLPYASPQFQEVVGVDPVMCINDATPLIQNIPVDELGWVSDHIREHAIAKSPVHIEFPISHPIKGMIWLAWHGVPAGDGSGGTLWNGLFIDVTERKLAEQSLRQSEARLLGIVDSSMDGIITIDEQQGILLFNPAAEHMFRCAESNVIGMTLDAFVNNFLRADSVLLLNMLERNEISNLRLGELSNIFGRRIGGEEFPLELAVSRSYLDGHRLLTMTLRDITERKRTAERLQLSQHQLRSALEAGAMGVMRIYSQSRQVEFDDKALTLCDIAQPSAQNWHSLTALMQAIHPADRRRISREYLSAIAGRSTFRTECRILHRDKSIHWLVFRGRVDQNEIATQATLTAIVADITYRKRLDEQRLQAQKLESLGVLAGGIAHDFNNLLLAIAGNVKLAMSDLPEHHQATSSLVEVSKAASRATDLVRRILAFSRPQDHKREPVFINTVVDEVLGLARAVLPAGIAINTDVKDKSLLVLADASQIHQALINLLTNAADAVPAVGGEVTVQLESVEADQQLLESELELHPGRYARVSIIDNGMGMDVQTLERIFDPFFTTKPVGQGTGLGLAIVHGIMKGHDGVVTVHSKEGEGTRFDLYFPVHDMSLDLPTIPKAAVNDLRQGHILYVDDEEALVFLVTRVLQRAGHKVSGFTTPTDALDAIRLHPESYDLVVSDMSMPGMSGLELARKVLAIRPGVPFIITTGFFRAEDYQVARDIGVRQLILKPNTVDELSSAIQRVLLAKSAEPA